ncbi:hypothetical protein LYSHEL_15120 [Lysobacter helvus]|uniref:Lysozyme inhibitor LprI-like N-terminal domain-containing protein n=2 Tax=Lysobacteraceae TaxID=32033 RepID=A0ABN6FXX1_9GAMM|nr:MULTISPECIES: lysozyme inhibitor LprI family protein [Lysobacter]BCT92488.1 hypothetical protein LYSCAS_15120 [Lysobacter caseinilyticus]BCT95641.1 hypothetical protein LYSHEL_15120 [Lysobacter helvus]
MLKRFAAFALFAVAAPAIAGDVCESGNTQDINECGRQGVERADKALNAAYQSLLAGLKADAEDYPEMARAREQLIVAQRLWVKFREADCDAIFTVHSGGTIRTAMYFACMQDRAEKRTAELKAYNESF